MNRRMFLGLGLASVLEAKKRKAAPRVSENSAAIKAMHNPSFAALDAKYLDTAAPLDAALEHALAGKNDTFEVPGLVPLLSRDRILAACIPSDEAIYFDMKTREPLARLRLREGSPERKQWETISDRNRARQVTVSVAAANEQRVSASTGKELSYFIGYADLMKAGIERLAPHKAYFQTIAKSYGLDENLLLGIALQETFAENLVSSAACKGYLQTSDGVARRFGLYAPKGNTRRKLLQRGVNESLHPLLQAEASAGYLRAVTAATGHPHLGVASYHAGPHNVLKMLAIGELRNSKADVSTLISWIYNGGYDDPLNTDKYSQFHQFSSKYVPQVLAKLNVAKFKSDPVDLERIAVNKAVQSEKLTAAYGNDFTAINPHVPSNVIIPAGVRVFVPYGEGRKAADRFGFDPSSVVVYHDGKITPEPGITSTHDFDHEYGEILKKRADAGLLAVQRHEVAALKNKYEDGLKLGAEWSIRRECINEDLCLFDTKSYQIYARAAKGVFEQPVLARAKSRRRRA
jgi:hypothetical protein